MKKVYLILVLSICLSNYTFSQAEMGASELLIKNRLPAGLGNIKVRIYPIGAFFRTPDIFSAVRQYSPETEYNDHPPNKPFITGGEKTLIRYIPDSLFNPESTFRIDQDGAAGSAGCDVTVGYGKYQVDIMYDFGSGWQIIKSFTMDWSDSDYPTVYHTINGFQVDTKVYVLDTNDVKIHHGGGNTEPYENNAYDFHDLSLFNNEIKIWYQYHKDPQGNDTIYSKIPNKNNFRTTNDSNSLFLNSWPIIGTDYLNLSSPGIHTVLVRRKMEFSKFDLGRISYSFSC